MENVSYFEIRAKAEMLARLVYGRGAVWPLFYLEMRGKAGMLPSLLMEGGSSVWPPRAKEDMIDLLAYMRRGFCVNIFLLHIVLFLRYIFIIWYWNVSGILKGTYYRQWLNKWSFFKQIIEDGHSGTNLGSYFYHPPDCPREIRSELHSCRI